MKIADFFVEIGTVGDTVTLKKFVESMGELPLAAAAAIATLAGVDLAFVKMADNAMQASLNFRIFTAETGLSSEELQRWMGAAKQMGVDTNAVASSLMNLQNLIAEWRLGNPQAMREFFLLGYNPQGKDQFQVLKDLLQNRRNLPPGMLRNLLGKVGVDPSLMIFSDMLRKNPAQFDRMLKASAVISTGQQSQFANLHATITRLGFAIQRVFLPAFAAIEPALEKFINMLTRLVNHAGPLIVDMVELMVRFASAVDHQFAQPMERLYRAFDMLATVLGRLMGLRGKKLGIGEFMEEWKKELMATPEAMFTKIAAMGSAFEKMLKPLDLLASLRSGLPSLAEASTAPNRVYPGVNLHQSIYSTADPQEVARLGMEFWKREVRKASTAVNNQGY